MRDEHAIFINAFEKLGTDQTTNKPYRTLKVAFCGVESDYSANLCGFTATVKESDYDILKSLKFGDEIDIVYNKGKYGYKVDAVLFVSPMDSKKK